jgi:putative intracellular protease/amidase
MNAPRILIILTSHDRLGDTGRPTGFWFDELAAPYYAFVDAGATVELGSPAGGRPPSDPASEREPPAAVRRFRDDPAAMAKLERTVRLADVADADGAYDAYFVAGGHGVMWDLARDPDRARGGGRAADAGGVVAAVCHGPAALVGVKLATGEPLVKGRRVAGFSNDEERAAHHEDTVPFLLETRLVELGARYERGPMWASFAVRDGALVTGQNPQSAVATAREVLAALGISETVGA